MSSLVGIIKNPALIAAFFGWLFAQLLKIPIGRYIDKEWNWKRGLSSGGMPSSHTSAVCAGATVIGLLQGFDSAIFALAALFAVIVMYDAAGVRRAAGKHAVILNEIIEAFDDDDDVPEEKLKEWIGHTPLEVFIGLWLGIGVGILVANISVLITRVG